MTDATNSDGASSPTQSDEPTFISDRADFYDVVNDLHTKLRTIQDRDRADLIEKNVQTMFSFLDIARRCVVERRSPRWCLRQIEVCRKWVDNHLGEVSRHLATGALRTRFNAAVRGLIKQGEEDATRANL